LDQLILYKFIEIMIFAMYMVFIFLSIQIWFLWRDLNKDEFKINIFINESFFKKNCIYVFSFSVFFMLHETIEGTSLTNATIYFEVLELLGFTCIVLFAHDWYSALRLSVHKKTVPHKLSEFTR
jgi:hypothetical protein